MLSWWIKYQNCNNKDTKTADILSLDNIHMYIKKKSNKAYILTNFSGRTEKYTCIILYQIDRIQFLTVWPQNCHPLPVPMQLLQSGTSSQPRTNGSGAWRTPPSEGWGDSEASPPPLEKQKQGLTCTCTCTCMTFLPHLSFTVSQKANGMVGITFTLMFENYSIRISIY